MANLVLDDINGGNFLGLEEGETLKRDLVNTHVFHHGMEASPNSGAKVDITVANGVTFLRLNAHQIRAADNTISVTDAIVIAFHRLLAVAQGLVSPAFAPADFNVDYSEAVRLTEAQTVAALGEAGVPTEAQIGAALTADVKRRVRTTFTDRVCLVAFVFRARGHHWMDSLEDLFQRVWRKTRHPENELHISFKNLARTALHAVYPQVLDAFWVDSVRANRCNGALAKRLDVAPAGFAGPHVLWQGLEDLKMIAPGLHHRVAAAHAYLEQQLAWARQDRWNGSVNARYYGAERGNLEEKRLGSIAATIKAAIDTLTDGAPLGKSPALQRIATNAPITGAVLVRAIAQVSARPEVVNTLLLE